jgi:hypothetical protein
VYKQLYSFGKWQLLAVLHEIKAAESWTVVEEQVNAEGEVVHDKVT